MFVIPAKAGIFDLENWIPVFTGMTVLYENTNSSSLLWILDSILWLPFLAASKIRLSFYR